MLDRLAAAIGVESTKLSLGITLSHLKKAKEVAQPILGTVFIVLNERFFCYHKNSKYLSFKTG